ncbi:unnamed protein product [Brassica oleracea var. botrytis]
MNPSGGGSQNSFFRLFLTFPRKKKLIKLFSGKFRKKKKKKIDA